MSSSKKNEKRALALVASAYRKLEAGNDEGAKQDLLEAWRMARESEKVLGSVVYLLSECGELESAMDVLQEALLLHGEKASILQLVGKVALQMEDFTTAEKIFALAVHKDPTNSEYYVNLISSLMKQDKAGVALDIAKQATETFPDQPELWNWLGIITKNELRDLPTARLFFKQAIELDRRNALYLYNLGSCLPHNPEVEEYWLREAVNLEPTNPQLNLSLGLFLLSRGKVSEAWSHYRYRRDPRLGANKASHIAHGLTEWRGEDLTAKSLIVCAEQGVGDEVLFLIGLKPLWRAGVHPYVVCDPRLVSIVERSFPGVRAFPFDDVIRYGQRYRSYPSLSRYLKETGENVDYFCLMGDLLEFAAPDRDSFAALEGGYFHAQPDYVLPKELGKAQGRPQIGFSWRSGNLKNERKYYYLELEFFIALSERVDADFYVLQYTLNDAEAALLQTRENIHLLPGIDLKSDLEGNLAIMSQLDLVMGPPVATQSLAFAAGVPTWLFNKGLPWYFLGEHEMPGFSADGSRWWCTHDYVLEPERMLEDVAKALTEYS